MTTYPPGIVRPLVTLDLSERDIEKLLWYLRRDEGFTYLAGLIEAQVKPPKPPVEVFGPGDTVKDRFGVTRMLGHDGYMRDDGKYYRYSNPSIADGFTSENYERVTS